MLDPHAARSRLMLWTVLAAAVALRAGLAMHPSCISRDGVRFVELAHKFTNDPAKWMPLESKQPGYPILLAATHRVFSTISTHSAESWTLLWERAGRWLAVITGAAVVLLVYLLAERLFNPTTAAIAGLFAAMWPQGVHLSADVLSDMPHLALYLLALWLAYRTVERMKFTTAAAAGIVAGLAYLVRQEAVGLLPAVAFAVWRCGTAIPTRRRAAVVAICFAGFALAAAPHSLAVGKFIPNKNPLDFLQDADAFAPPVGVMLASQIAPWQAPSRMAEEWARGGRYVFAALFLVCMFVRTMPVAERRGRDLFAVAALAQLALVQLRVSAYGEISSRYLVIPVVLSIPWAAAAFAALVTRISLRIYDPSPPRRAAVWLSGFIIALTPLILYATRPVNAGKEHLRIAGLWLADRADDDDTIVAHNRLEQLMFYAGRAFPRDASWRRTRPTDDPARVYRVLDRVRRNLDGDRAAWYIDATRSRGGETPDPPLPGFIDAMPERPLQLQLRESAKDGDAFIWSMESRTAQSVPPSDRPRD